MPGDLPMSDGVSVLFGRFVYIPAAAKFVKSGHLLPAILDQSVDDCGELPIAMALLLNGINQFKQGPPCAAIIYETL